MGWAVRYENCMTAADAKSKPYHSLGFNVFLSDQVDAPHFTIHVGVRGDTKATIMGDFVPRHDLAFAGLDQYKLFETKWTSFKKELGGFEEFASSDATVRSIQSPYNIAYALNDLEDNQCLESFVRLLDLYRKVVVCNERICEKDRPCSAIEH